jgi:hypothetical protein
MIFVLEHGEEGHPQITILVFITTEEIDLNTDEYKPVRQVFFCETMDEASDIVRQLQEEHASNRN